MFTSKGTAGRLIRGYWAVECKSKEVVFLKDIWCTDVPEVETKGAILKGLSEADVWHIPELVCHGDILDGGEIVSTPCKS